MLSLDLFDSRYERDLREGAVDNLEARRIDDLNMRMLELLDRAKEPAYKKNPGALAGLKRQFQKIKDERDSYFKINPATGMDPTGSLGTTKGHLDVDEGGIPGNVPVEKIPGKEDLLKGKGRSYYEDQKKNSESVDEHGGGIGPRQHWQDLMQETVTDVRPLWADVYRRLAPKIERHRDSFLAGQLYDELENIAELHGAEGEFKRMMNGARNRAHMEYDTNPGGFQNWFWFLPFEDNDVAESADDIKKRMSKLEALALAANRAGDDAKCKMYQQKIQSLKQKLSQSMAEGWSDAIVSRRTGQPRTPYSVYINGRKWKDFENDDHAQAVANKLKAKFRADGRDPETITIAPTDMSEARATKTSLDPKCWTGKKIGNPKTKVKGGVRVNNCVPAESVNEDQDTSGVEQAILKRIMVAHLDLLRQYGPEKVMQAAEEVAYNVGDVDEIGTSDVSAYVQQVKQILGAVA